MGNDGLGRRHFLQLSTMATGTAALATAGAVGAALETLAAAQASGPPPQKVGAHLIGKLEGPEVVLDRARWPKKLAEAPMLAEQVRAAKLPPVEKRLPDEPLVIKPVHEIGRYGGTWRRGFTGPADFENGNRIVSSDKPLFWDYTGTKVVPSVAKDWKVSGDGRTITLSLRKGMRWSDGAPFTANDFVFWFEDMYQNKDLTPGPEPELSIDGEAARIEKVDEYTVAFVFPKPNHLFVNVLASSTQIGGGHALRGRTGKGAYAPAHYLKQFHPRYVPKDELDQKIKDHKFENWVGLFRAKNAWALNPELPVLTPWRTTSPITSTTWVLERNPYYYAVDTAGNQLPYIDRIVMTTAENLEVLNLRAIAGQYDVQERHTDFRKLPVFLENQAKGDYKVRLDPALNGSDAALQFNQSYEADPEIAKFLTNKDFRHALSLGIDRDQLNETFWLGVGTPGSTAPAEGTIYSPGAAYRKLWCVYDLKQANELLDRIGLAKRDADGYRLRTDGRGRLRIEIMSFAAGIMPFPKIAEMIAVQWQKIGIQGDVKEVERSLAYTRMGANEHQTTLDANDGSELLFFYPRAVLPTEPNEAPMGPLYARWYASGGQHGRKPADPEMVKALEMLRSAPGLKPDEQVKAAQEIWRIVVEAQWSVGIVGQSPAFMGVRVIKNNMGNVPARQVNAQHARTPGSSHPATFYVRS